MWLYLWWPILYTYVHFCTYGTFDGLFCTNTSSCLPIFYVPPLHYVICTLVTFMANLYIYICLGLSLHIYGYMCTYLCWRILYTYLLLIIYSVHRALFDGLFCTLTSPCLIYSLQVPRLDDLVCSLVSLWSILYIYFSLERYFMTTCARTSGELFCTHTSS